jgi:hypothetical protein
MTELKEIDFESISIKDLEKIAEKESLGMLKERMLLIQRYIRDLSERPLETILEKMERRKKLNEKVTIINLVIRKKELEEQKQNTEIEQEHTKTTLKENLADFRMCKNSSQILGYMRGIYTIDVLEWQKIPSMKFEVEGFKVDLEKMPFSLVRRLMEKRLSPVILTLRPEGMTTSKGQLRDFWYPTGYNETRGDEIKPAIYISLMWC